MKRTQIVASLMEDMYVLFRLMSKFHSPIAVKGSPTRAQLGLLMMVSHGGAQNTKDLAKKFEMSSSAVTQLVDALVQDKLLTRTEDKKDRRKIWLDITDLGRKKLEQTQKRRLKLLIEMFKPLTHQDIEHLKRVQVKIIESLKK